MALTLIPNSELVVVQWIKTVPALAAEGVGVATSLPVDNATWGPTGFVVVNILSGRRDAYLSAGRPVVQLEAFAVRPDTGRPLWNKSSNILSAIEAAVEDEATIRRLLTLTVGGRDYGQARVMSCYPIEEQMRLYKPASDLRLTYGDDQGQYARKAQTYAFHWVKV